MNSEKITGKKKPLKIILVGMGARASIYAEESRKHPDLFSVVGVADVNPDRVRMAAERYGIPPEHCFDSVEALTAVPVFADAAINGTMDPQHVETTIPLLEKGYDVLLEKPFAVNRQEADRLLDCVRRTGRRVMVCHVLRYAPFYREIWQCLREGAVGKVIHIQMAEQVSYFHESVSYVRGKYASPRICGSGMLLSKCSHDLDIMAWLMGKNRPRTVSSVGSLFQFREDQAPEGAGTRCMTDCRIERKCPYSARRLYVEHPQRWANNIWFESGVERPSAEERIRILMDPDNPFGRCVYRCDLEIVDHQSVLIGFEDGATGGFSMNGGASASGRMIHITGTRGELKGMFEEQKFQLWKICPEAPEGRILREYDVSHRQQGNAHGNGDQAVIRDFVALLRGEEVTPCCTTLEDSVVGHRIAFLAEESRRMGGQLLTF